MRARADCLGRAARFAMPARGDPSVVGNWSYASDSFRVDHEYAGQSPGLGW
jgi:hypothetical protein